MLWVSLKETAAFMVGIVMVVICNLLALFFIGVLLAMGCGTLLGFYLLVKTILFG